MNAETFIKSLGNYFIHKNMTCEYDENLNGDKRIKLFVRYSVGQIFRKNYYICVCDCSLNADDDTVIAMHESVRKIINSYYKTPKWLRINVPVIVSMFVVDRDVSKRLIDYNKKISISFLGGECNYIYFFNISNMAINDPNDIKDRILSERFNLLSQQNLIGSADYNIFLDLVFYDFIG